MYEAISTKIDYIKYQVVSERVLGNERNGHN